MLEFSCIRGWKKIFFYAFSRKLLRKFSRKCLCENLQKGGNINDVDYFGNWVTSLIMFTKVGIFNMRWKQQILHFHENFS
jgi:hypothetical protein